MNGLRERRLQYTKHLHTIIATNEQRKANKLEELLEKLDISEDIKDEIRDQPRYKFSGFPDDLITDPHLQPKVTQNV